MTEVERIQGRISAIEAEKRQAEINWQRCDGAAQVLRHMLGEAMQAEDAALTELARMNGALPAAPGE